MESNKREDFKKILRRYAHKGCAISYALLHPETLKDKENINKLNKIWEENWEYFETNLKTSFLDFYAEIVTAMYLMDDSGLSLYNKKIEGAYPHTRDMDHGPDFKVKEKNIWVECISATNRTPSKRIRQILKKELGLFEFFKYYLKGSNLMLLNPISSKRKKFKKYLKEGIVKENDTLIISVSLHKMKEDFSEKELKKAVEDFFKIFKVEDIDGVLCFYGDLGEDKNIFVSNPNKEEEIFLFG